MRSMEVDFLVISLIHAGGVHAGSFRTKVGGSRSISIKEKDNPRRKHTLCSLDCCICNAICAYRGPSTAGFPRKHSFDKIIRLSRVNQLSRFERQSAAHWGVIAPLEDGTLAVHTCCCVHLLLRTHVAAYTCRCVPVLLCTLLLCALLLRTRVVRTRVDMRVIYIYAMICCSLSNLFF